MLSFRVSRVGTSIGFLLPKDLCSRLRVKVGDTLHVRELPEGLLVTPWDPDFGRDEQTTRPLRVTSSHSSLLLIVPKDLAERLKLVRGTVVHVTESPEGLHVRPYDPAFAREFELAESFLWSDKDLFHALARGAS